MLTATVAALLGVATAAVAVVTGSANPNSGLQDGQTVALHTEGLPGNTSITAVMCTRTATSSSDCEGQTGDPNGSSNASGVYDYDYTVYALPNPLFQGTSIKCDASNPCSVYIGTDVNDFSAPKVLVPVEFAAAPDPVVPEVGKVVALPLSAMGLLGLGYAAARKRRTPAVPVA